MRPDITLTVAVADWRDVSIFDASREVLLKALQAQLASAMRRIERGVLFDEVVALSWTVKLEEH